MKNDKIIDYNLAGNFKEILGIGLIFLSFFLFISLITYHPFDPSLSTELSKGESIHNYCGILGSYISDFLLQTIGIGSFVLIILLTALAIIYLAVKDIQHKFLRLFGTILLSFFVTIYLQLTLREINFNGNEFYAGGFSGLYISRMLTKYVGFIGSYIVIVAFSFASFLLMTLISLKITTKYTINFAIRLLNSIYAFVQVRTTRFYRERELKKHQESEPHKSPISFIKEKIQLLKSGKISKPIEPIIRPNEPEIIEYKGSKNRIGQAVFEFEKTKGEYQLPPISLLDDPPRREIEFDKNLLIANSKILEKKLTDFGITGRVTEVKPGPIITLYEYEPAAGVKINQIVKLQDDLAMALRALSVRLIAPIPGKSVVGIEVSNAKREEVYLKEIIGQKEFIESTASILFGLGKDISGDPEVANLEKMPHLLIAGTTGSGKSVFLNTVIVSILYKATPHDVRFIFIDPKYLELTGYDDIPHLLLPVVCEPKKAVLVLKWATREMERRYRLLSELKTKSIDAYNKELDKIKDDKKDEFGAPLQKLPFIVIVIDELTDLIMTSPREIEELIVRLAQMARACGIHLIVATQRPSTDVITGIIKANFPTRVSFQVASKTDSRVILDTQGAETLLGKGDMLFMPPGTSKLKRIHAPKISEAEIKNVVDFWKGQGKPLYDEEVMKLEDKDKKDDDDEPNDEMYDQAVVIVKETGKASISMLQRRLRVGYNRAARMIEKMEEDGLVGPTDGVKQRDVIY